MVERVAGRIPEESLKSDQVPVPIQELVTQVDADPNQVELDVVSAWNTIHDLSILAIGGS